MDRKRLWLVIPSVMFVTSLWTWWNGEVNFRLLSVSYGIYKALEYSLRGALTEMVRTTFFVVAF